MSLDMYSALPMPGEAGSVCNVLLSAILFQSPARVKHLMYRPDDLARSVRTITIAFAVN